MLGLVSLRDGAISSSSGLDCNVCVMFQPFVLLQNIDLLLTTVSHLRAQANHKSMLPGTEWMSTFPDSFIHKYRAWDLDVNLGFQPNSLFVCDLTQTTVMHHVEY